MGPHGFRPGIGVNLVSGHNRKKLSHAQFQQEPKMTRWSCTWLRRRKKADHIEVIEVLEFLGKEPVPCNLNLPAHSAQSSVLVGSWLGHGPGVGASWLYQENQAADPHVGLAGQVPWMLVRVRCHWWGLGFENMSLNVSECHMLKPVLSVCFEKCYSLVGWSLDCTFHHPWMSGRV